MAMFRAAASSVRDVCSGAIAAALVASLDATAPAADIAPQAQAATALSPAMAVPTPATPVPVSAAPFATAIPALTPVKLEIVKKLSTKISKEGDSFPLRLAEPIMINGMIVAPAGAEGIGEVIESKRGGMAGGAGVLILAARYVVVDGRHLRLRSMHMAQTGRDNRGVADAIAFAGGLPGSFIGFLIPGGGMAIAAGTIADAKTAEDFSIGTTSAVRPPAPLTAATPAVSPVTTVSGSQTISTSGRTQ